MFYLGLALMVISYICMGIFVLVLIRNVVIRKSLTGWLFPDGTTKREKIFMSLSLSVIVVSLVAAALIAKFFLVPL